MKHLLDGEFEKAAEILRSRGFTVHTPITLNTVAPRMKIAFILVVLDTDIEMTIGIDAVDDDVTTVLVSVSETDSCKGHTDHKEKIDRARVETAEKIVSEFDAAVAALADRHNKDHNEFVRDLQELGDSEETAEQSAEPFTGGRWDVNKISKK